MMRAESPLFAVGESAEFVSSMDLLRGVILLLMVTKKMRYSGLWI